MKRIASIVVVGLVSSLAASARAAPTREECIDADTNAQSLRKAGKLRDARAALEVCTNEACPGMVRQDCAERLEELNRVSPSVMFDVKDTAGRDVIGASVAMDGKPLVDRVGATATPVDPGEHEFVVTARGHLPNKVHVLVHEGDKDKRVEFIVGAPAIEEPAKPVEESAPEHEAVVETPAAPGSSQRVAAIVVGATGLAGLGVAAVLAGVSVSAWQTSLGECSASACGRHDLAVADHNTAFDFATAATVALIAGGALTATGFVLFFTAPRAETMESARRRFHIAPMLGKANGVFLTGVFP